MASVKTLLKLAKDVCELASMRMLTKQPSTTAKLILKDTFIGKYINAPCSEPDVLVRQLAVASHLDKDCLIKQMHMYPLGVKKISKLDV